MKIVLDFVTGKISCDEFKTAWYNNPEIGLWLDSLVDLQAEPKPEWEDLPYHGFRMAIYKHYNGSVLQFINAGERFRETIHKRSKWLDISWYFHPIAAVIVAAFPDVVPTTYYDEEQAFYNAVVGDYIGGQEVDEFIAELMAHFPISMGKTKRKREARAAIRNLFHIEGSKYPRWAQEAEWPMGTKSPMVFVSQKRNGDLVQFLFKDVDTNETRVVEQLY